MSAKGVSRYRPSKPRALPREPKRGSALTSAPVYTDDELEFMKAVERYKAAHKTRFPSLSQILSVIRELGYRKVGAEGGA